MRQLAADLSRALGSEHVSVDRDAPANSGAPSPELDVESPPIVTAIVDDMNRERAARGLKPLRLNRRLSLAADDRVADMLSKHYFEHVSPEGMEPWTWADRRGYDYREIGENLAVGYPSADAVVNGWMRSPGHRANILGRDFDEVGIAVAPQSPMRGYAAPLVVALYGTR